MKKLINKFLNKQKRFAGLDVGNSSVKFMEIEGETIETAKLTHYAIEPIPQNIKNLDKVEAIQELSNIIKNCWKKSGSKNKQVVVSLSANSTIYKKTMISDFDSEDAVQTQVENEIVKYFPNGMSLDDVAVDFYSIGPNPQSPTDNDTLLIAGKKEKIDELLAMVESSGLNPVILDVDIYSIQNLLRLMKGDDFLNKNYIFLDCGGTLLRMMVFKNAELVYTKEIEVGGVQLSNDIMLNLGVEKFEEAEKIKINRAGDETYEMIEKQFLLDYCHNFIRALDYFGTATSIKEVEEIILSGGMANIPKLDEIMNTLISEGSEIKFNNPPYVARPLQNITKDVDLSLGKLNRDEAGLFLVTSLAIRHFLRQY